MTKDQGFELAVKLASGTVPPGPLHPDSAQGIARNVMICYNIILAAYNGIPSQGEAKV